MKDEGSRTVAATVVESTHVVLPGEANSLGTVFGGQVCAWLDLACAVAAMRHCRRPVVTVSMDELVFHAPVRVGHFALLRAQVNAVFRTSLEVGAEVYSEHPLTGERRHTTSAFLTFVALGEDGRPLPMPPLVCVTDEERRREREAHERRERRLLGRMKNEE